MKITNWPQHERPREKLLQFGAETLSDAELLGIVIGNGIKGKNAVELGRDALAKHGSVRAIISANKKQLGSTPGFGLAKFATLNACFELSKRSLAEAIQKPHSFTHADSASSYLLARLRDKPHEVFSMLLLDSQHQLIAFRDMFTGTINSAAVYPRELVKQALEDNAAAVILAHNHPSGVAEPSQADIQITNRIQRAMELIDVRVLDHFVVGDSSVVSFAQRGLL
ncbi:DNA repair protein RadC [Glaciecola sp. MH2013]|uniref:RadC family protein n=1 Tax=Glaciecola sp. MH2013 TaxID=2785524 RepID=UPI00189C8888|nr:DNA repair protein RadC [Glaciecola sp. MH2013]MBF7073358.1 DNA repair protein RadC [Glaciecola sp. MH2013]